MNGRVIWRVFAAILLVAVLVGAGWMVYNAGIMQGLAQSGKLALPNAAAPNGGTAVQPPYPYYYPYWGPFGWGHGFGFFPFGCLFPLLFFFLIFFLIRGVFFRGPRHWGRWHGGPYGGPGGYDPEQVPPFVEQWHRKMHGSEETTSPSEEAK